MTDNELLSEISGKLDEVIEALEPQYTNILSTSSTVETADGYTLLRAADPLAIKSVVVNEGPDEARIYEGGGQVAILYKDETWESPMTGTGQINVDVPAGTASLTLSTYRKTP